MYYESSKMKMVLTLRKLHYFSAILCFDRPAAGVPACLRACVCLHACLPVAACQAQFQVGSFVDMSE
jgi:hypothetical protein